MHKFTAVGALAAVAAAQSLETGEEFDALHHLGANSPWFPGM